MSEKRTELEELGEFGLIAHLTKNIVLENKSTVKGIGDDGAVLKPEESHVVVSTDLLVEGVHFDLTYVPLKHLGYKAAVVNMSDVYAMNASPKQLTLSIAISNRFSKEALEMFYEGFNLACSKYKVDLVGGDTSSSSSGMLISVTAIGEVNKKNIAYRSGAKENDLLCVSGDLGGAYVGLQILEREKQVFKGNPSSQPDLEGFDYILERQLKPEPRKDVIDSLASLGVVPTSMIDVSDGLASELMHICNESDLACQVYEDKIPIDYQTDQVAKSLNLDPTMCALNGGEDYELLFTVSQKDYEKIKDLKSVAVIGHMTKKDSGLNLVTKGGTQEPIVAQGWSAFTS